MVHPTKHLINSSRVAYHLTRSHHFCHISSWYHCWRLVIDTRFETSGAPINKLNRSLASHRSNCSTNISGNNISSIWQWASYEFTMSSITLRHLICRLENLVSKFCNWHLLMVGSFSIYYGRVGRKHKVNTRIGY